VTENEIIAGCLKKNAICQHLLFAKYSRKLMTVCSRYAGTSPEAEDMLQDSFIKIFSSIHQYRSEGSFEGWLKKITVNTCLRKLEKIKIVYDDLATVESLNDDVHPDVISTLTEKELIGLISSLPNGYRVVFNLNVIEGYSHDEIATMLGIEQATSRSQLMKARRQLQKQLLDYQKIILQHERKRI
jgi:RNA polymerase sigma-70 factor (ECF subfamily)